MRAARGERGAGIVTPRLMVLLATLAVLIAVLAFAPMRFADRLIYFPTSEHDGGTPAALRLPYEDVDLTTGDGVRLHAWFVPKPGATRVLLFLHGNAGNISHRLEKLEVFNDLGASVLLLDYRGYGRSQGTPDEAGTYRDADAAYEWLRARGIPAEQIVAYGESLGGPIATDLAARRPLGGLIMESAPSSIVAVAKHHYPILPAGLLLSARYDAASKIGGVRVPVLIMHSPNDEIVPFALGEALYAAANSPKQLVKLRGGHNDSFLIAGDVYRESLRTFLRRFPLPPGEGQGEGIK